tara:strand:+ start:622 stop:789 length:168 start_codon:yes stop_codon:yes gene_type:complete
MVWWILLGIFVISQCVVIWGMVTAPTMPDDFEIKEKDIWPLNQQPDTKEDANKEN